MHSTEKSVFEMFNVLVSKQRQHTEMKYLAKQEAKKELLAQEMSDVKRIFDGRQKTIKWVDYLEIFKNHQDKTSVDLANILSQEIGENISHSTISRARKQIGIESNFKFSGNLKK